MLLTTIGFWIGIVLLLDASCGIIWFNAFQKRFKRIDLRKLIAAEIILALTLVITDVFVTLLR
jgi:uncharacterized membrane protein YidH (DUF202 family)